MSVESDELRGMGAAFPFLMVLSSFFVTGFVFISVDMPLVLKTLEGRQFDRVYDVVVVLKNYWVQFIKRDVGASIIFIYCLSALISGIAIQQVTTVGASLLGKIASKLIPSASFYTTTVSFSKADAQFKAWLHKHKLAKLEWEWQLFLYYVYSGLCTNVLVTSFAVWSIVRASRPLTCWLIITCGLSIAYILARSSVMQTVDDYFRRESEKQA
jgi:hypothetical protein